MAVDRFYELSAGGSGDPFSAVPDPPLSGEQERRLLLGEWRPDTAIVFRQNTYKRTPGHLVVGGSPAMWLVSKVFIYAIERGGCTGWASWPIQLLDKHGQLVGDYVGLAVTGRSGPIQFDERREIVDEHWQRGAFIDEITWDGSDLFHPADQLGGVLVTARVKDAIASAHLKAVSFEPLSECEYYRDDS